MHVPQSPNGLLHIANSAKIDFFTERDKNLPGDVHQDMVGGSSIVFTREAIVEETLFRNSSNICKSTVGNDAGQLYTYSICQTKPTRFVLDVNLMKFYKDSNTNKTRQDALVLWLCLFWPNQTRLWNRELLHHRNSEKKWLLQCKSLFRALKHRVWSHGLILFLLFLPGSASVAKKEMIEWGNKKKLMNNLQKQ